MIGAAIIKFDQAVASKFIYTVRDEYADGYTVGDCGFTNNIIDRGENSVESRGVIGI